MIFLKNIKLNISNLRIIIHKLSNALLDFKFDSIFLLFLILITTFTEALSISLIYPLIQSLTPESTNPNNASQYWEYIALDFNIYSMLFIFFLAIFIKNILAIIRYYYEEHLTALLRKKYMSKLSELIFNGEYKKVSKYQIGNLNSILINETLHISICLKSVVRMLSSILLSFFLFLVFLYYHNNPQTLLFLILFIVILFILKPIGSYARNLGKIRLQSLQDYSGFLSDYIINYRQVKLLGIEKKSINNLLIYSQKLINVTKLMKFVQQIARPTLETLFILGIISYILFYLVIANFNLNQILPFIALFIVIGYRSLTQIDTIIKSLFAVSNNIVSFDKVEKLINDLENSNSKNNLKKLENYNENIIFKDISFSYEKEKIFNNLSLEIPYKSKILIKGKSGSGKSTLVDLLVKLQEPNSGNIFIGNENLKNLDPTNLRKKIAYVSQEVLLFNDSIFENIKSVKPDLTEEEFEKYSKLTLCHEFIKNLKEDKKFIVGDRGLNLSGGQRQRIGILRSIINSPEIIILDESTNALDKKLSEELLKNLFSYFRDSTIIFITHGNTSEELFNQTINLDEIKKNNVKI
tara:strand:+ start:26434 stop:28176 length:1743 start_codon:yes stop_codon:yes gene_type:complete